jgi:energy-coupling factor transporter ATP-binding protein EcfA2
VVAVSKEYSPFTPDSPVPPEFFVGRKEEIEALLLRVRMARQGRVETAFLTGPRGIGKSSLARFLRHIASAQERVAAVHVALGGTANLEEMVRRVFDRLLKDVAQQPIHRKLLDLFGDHVQKVGLFGVTLEFRAREKELRDLVSGFGDALSEVLKRLRPEVEGLLIILDDINGLAELPGFADWLKTTIDSIAIRDVALPLCLVLVGIPERRVALVHSNPSVARLFTPVALRLWTTAETESFFQTAFGKVDVTVAADALRMLATFSGGLPVLAQEIGHATFAADEDGIVDVVDAGKGVIAAAGIVGAKHLDPTVYDVLRSERYRAILRKLGELGPSESLKRAEVRSRLSEAEARVLDNFLTRMKKLGVLVADPEGGAGACRFANPLYPLYVAMEAQRAKARRP